MPYYIAAIRGFDHSETAPTGSVFVSDEAFQALFEGQSAGASIVPDRQGFPVLVSAPSLTPAELVAIAQARRDELLATAALRIAPLQDAVDIELASDAEASALKAWKLYRVYLNRIELQDDFPAEIEWPIAPS